MSGEDEDIEVSLVSSIFLLVISFMILSIPIMDYTIKPLFRDGSIISMGRYSMTQDALSTIEEDDKKTVIAIGSSMMFKAFNGSCFNSLDGRSDTNYYNLAIPNSRPYNDMLHIPKIIKSNPDVVIIEVGVNTLSDPTPSSEEYIEFRYKMDTMLQDDSDVGGWLPLIEDRYGDWLATNQIERQIFKQKWFPEAVEELSRRFFLNESGVYPYGTYPQIPSKASPEWISFLQEPEWPPTRFDRMTVEESEKYNQTEMSKSASLYFPKYDNTLSHQAIDYMVNELTKSGIKVVLATMPHHPLVFQYLVPGQWDALNHSLEGYTSMEKVTIFDNTWAHGWSHEHFDDRNHLDGDGRDEFCQRGVSVISRLIDAKSPSDFSYGLDTDQDGYADHIDNFPDDFFEHSDLDGDGVGDNSDAFPNDFFEQKDSDGDGVGDNSDIWPNDSNYSLDSDNDGIPDVIDMCYSPIIAIDQQGFTDYGINSNGCYNVLPEEGVYILPGGMCDSFLCTIDSEKPKLDFTILTVKYTTEMQMWVDYNDNNESESWERNYDDMFAWFYFEFNVDEEWLNKSTNDIKITTKYSRQFMFNYIDNSTGQALSHLVEISPCKDINENDQLIGPIKILDYVYSFDLTNELTSTDSFSITNNQNQSWIKISNLFNSAVNVCD